MPPAPTKHFLVVSDFDQTLSFNDSGQILSELLGMTDFRQKVDGLASSNLVQQGAELAYLIRHDPAFRGVRKEHLAEAGRLVRLRSDIPALVEGTLEAASARGLMREPADIGTALAVDHIARSLAEGLLLEIAAKAF